MPDRTAFFDTSAIVPICVAQRTSQTARETYRTFSKQVVAWTTLIEATGAIHRAVRLGGLSQSNEKRALDRLGQDRVYSGFRASHPGHGPKDRRPGADFLCRPERNLLGADPALVIK